MNTLVSPFKHKSMIFRKVSLHRRASSVSRQPFIFGIFGKMTCFWNLTKPDNACLPSLTQSCVTSSRISETLAAQLLHNNQAQMRQRFYKPHWNILLPENWSTTNLSLETRGSPNPGCVPAPQQGWLVQARARQEVPGVSPRPRWKKKSWGGSRGVGRTQFFFTQGILTS